MIPSIRSRHAALAAVAALSVLCGCALRPYEPTRVHPGDTRAAVEATMGPPTAVYALADGRQRLEYNHQPAGLQTYMIDLGPDGRVASWEQVLDENHFATIAAGMTEQDVLQRLGPPAERGRYAHPVESRTWTYRWQSPLPCVVFVISFDAATGRVLEPGSYPPDRRCGPIRA
ncbi:MAG TPA: hypothetical protein VF453_01310 [Burkholderiaceae bacterium]